MDWTLFTLEDIADQKRRQVLHHAFFHDVLNDVTVLIALAEMSLLEDGSLDKDLMRRLLAVCRRMGGEVQGQRDLLLAETGHLTFSPERFDPAAFLKELVELYAHGQTGDGREIRLDLPRSAETLETDRSLLSRVMGNLIKNALEATSTRGTVEVRYERKNGRHVFRVRNPGAMPEDAQLQVFQRSFSTKGVERGIGTYNSKLLTERYLRGRIWFESDPAQGTSFFVELP